MSVIEKISSPILYSSNGDDVEITLKDENVWATQKSMSEIFDTDRSVITKHLGNIFSENELQEISNVQKMHIANSSKPVKFYSLDVIISVGYRVNSKKATQFRVWSNSIIKQYIKDGYVINEEPF